MKIRSESPVFVFDADGVVIEPWGFANVLKIEHNYNQEQLAPFFKGPFHGCLRGQTELDKMLPDFLRRWNWSGSTNDFISLWMESENKPVADVLEMIQGIRKMGFMCCLASNQENIRARFIEQEMNFKSQFDKLYFSCDLGVVKPELEYYNKICTDLQVDASDIYFLDDTSANVEAALQANWNAERFTCSDSVKLILLSLLRKQRGNCNVH